MSCVVVDTSVAVAWLVPEVKSEAALTLFDQDGVALIAPDLLLLEVGNALWKKVRKNDLTTAEADAVAHRLPRLLDEIHPSAAYVHRARAISFELDHPIYDCVYLALAEAKDCPLVGDDRRLKARVRGTRWDSRVVVLG